MLPLFFDGLPEFRSNPFLSSNFIDPATLSLISESQPLSDDTRLLDASPFLCVTSSTSSEPPTTPPTVPDDFLAILENIRDATSIARMLNTPDRELAIERLLEGSRSKYLLDPRKVYTTANVDAAWSPHGSVTL
jgi:hypothetical protein